MNSEIMLLKSRLIRMLLIVAGLVLAGAVGFVATNHFQRTVPIVPGLQGCWRLEGSVKQISCLSDEFLNGADEAAGSTSNTERDDRVIEYVRRAERLAAGDARLADSCHPAMHSLGRREGSRAADEERTPRFPDGSAQLCTAGYTHGLAEGYLFTSPAADVGEVFPMLCHDESARDGCAHGIGHALLRSKADTSHVTGTDYALRRCGELPSDFRAECHNGVYMELAMRTEPAPLSIDEYATTCADAKDVERELSCWAYLTLSVSTNDVGVDAIPDLCAQASLPGQFTCIDAYGRELGVSNVADCHAAATRPALQERCVEGAIGLQVGSGHVSTERARVACTKMEASGLRRHCENAVDRYARGRAQVENS